jgi:ribosome-associated protein
MKEYMQDNPDDDIISKSQRKRDMDSLQDLGKELVDLPNDKLKRMELPEDLLTALLDHKRFTSHGAKKRQEQYIGKLMREVDPEPIRRQVAMFKGDSAEHNAWLHLIERLRERLLADDAALAPFLVDYPGSDVQTLRTQIRNARKEQLESKPPKHFRLLFQTLKTIIPEPGHAVPEGEQE